MPIILATWEAEIGMIKVHSRPAQGNSGNIISKITTAKWNGDVPSLQAQSPKFKPSPTNINK
jgi:hypothetical protein